MRIGGGITITIGASASAAAAAQVVEIRTDPAGVDGGVLGHRSRRAAGTGPAQSVILEVLPTGEVNTLWRLKDEMVYSLVAA